jgi:hypothetical protein
MAFVFFSWQTPKNKMAFVFLREKEEKKRKKPIFEFICVAMG